MHGVPCMGHLQFRKVLVMWKILVAFAIFAALAVFILAKSGGNVDLGGEKHEVAPAAAEPAASK